MATQVDIAEREILQVEHAEDRTGEVLIEGEAGG